MEDNATHHLAGEGYDVTIYSDQMTTGKREVRKPVQWRGLSGANDHRYNTPLTCIERGCTR